MPSTDPSKYAENQIESATRKSLPLMSELLADTVPRATTVVGANASFTTVMFLLNLAATNWTAGETVLANAEAALPSSTSSFEDKMASLTRKPDADTSSPLEIWDTTIRLQVAYQGPTYLLLLPQGRETVTAGTIEQQLDALRDFGSRLTGQAAKPVLVALGTTVTAFATAARALRTAQTNAKAALDNARSTMEPKRLAAAAAVYALIGQGMVVWSTTPALVDTLWDVNILRSAPQEVPGTPVDTAWTPAQRTLSTSVMPPGGSRLEAWREGPGGMPEKLLTGARGETSVLIPATITFTPGGLYQLWLVAVNGKGSSLPGPVQNWTAV